MDLGRNRTGRLHKLLKVSPVFAAGQCCAAGPHPVPGSQRSKCSKRLGMLSTTEIMSPEANYIQRKHLGITLKCPDFIFLEINPSPMYLAKV